MNRTFISTNTFSKAFLSKAWEARNQLSDYEKRGFAQFFYLTICGHVESLLASIISSRTFSIRRDIDWKSISSMQYQLDGTLHTCSLEPVIASIEQLIQSLEKETESAALTKLIELYNRTFPESLRKTIGADLFNDQMLLHRCAIFLRMAEI